ncbi:MAG: hypothetical protein JRH18_00155 [Deltaproteobacteria bacterium]|nr:hypothetical protein [Deltaproteobacteria bacterium]MBW1995414.1 hypothetical protein [Deltaproteobacteria bacterium]MBW2150059.1 hypothetical protein [Deltaproteobacteria bacterium]
MASFDQEKSSGIQSLIHRYRKRFRIPENLNHYSDQDFRKAERKFLKFSLKGYGAGYGSYSERHRRTNH